MADLEFQIPKFRPHPEVPSIVPGSMAHSRPHVANEKIQDAIGYQTKLDEDWQVTHDKAIAKFGELLGKYRSLPYQYQRMVREIVAALHVTALQDNVAPATSLDSPQSAPPP